MWMLLVTCRQHQVQHCLESTGRVAAGRLPYRVKVTAAKRYAWCACGHSKKQVSLTAHLELLGSSLGAYLCLSPSLLVSTEVFSSKSKERIKRELRI